MAAPRVLQVRHCLRPLLPCSCGQPLQQVRHHKNQRRFRAPSVAKEKEKWVPRSQRKLVVEKIIPKNWEEKFLSRVPMDDVWIRSHYPPLELTFQESVERHTELVAAPEMLDRPDAVLHMEAWLDMRTKKKTKFMSNIASSVILPHNFDDGQVNRVIVFTRTDEEQQKALEMGAVAAGYAELMRNIASGDIGPDDYEHAVCLHDMLPDITNLRKFMKDKFPSKGKGSLGDDIEEMLVRFRDGKVYTSTKEEDAVGKIQVKLGTLSMGAKTLEENFRAYVEVIGSHRSVDLGQFITKAILTCPPSKEKFYLRPDQVAIKKKVQPKKERKVKQQEEEDNEEREEAVAA